MHFIPSTRRARLSVALRASLLLAAAAAFGACDRHSAEEAPENYGHGSNHHRAVPDHEIDSRDSKNGLKSFSDTDGTTEAPTAEEGHAKPEASPSPSATPVGRFF